MIFALTLWALGLAFWTSSWIWFAVDVVGAAIVLKTVLSVPRS